MSDELLVERARVHAALSDPGRLAIVDALGYGDASPGEIARTLRMPSNLLAHHLRVLEQAGLVGRTRSEGDRRRTYLRLAPQRLSLAESEPSPRLGPLATPAEVPRVVFVCTHNSARSQLAAALWTRRNAVPAASAGTTPAARVHPRAVRVARRHGLAIGRARPVNVASVLHRDDLVIAVCDKAYEQLAENVGLHWSIPDPAPVDTDDAFESVYADIARRIDRLSRAVKGVRP